MIPSNIYQIRDYRAFLKDRYHQLKTIDSSFSFRNFSKTAGFGSPNYLKLVMDGKRNLSQEAIQKFSKGLRLDQYEAEYFKYLVIYGQCSEEKLKEVYAAKLDYLKELFEVKDFIPEHYEYYHDWYHSAIRKLVASSESLENDPEMIAKSLAPEISMEEAQKSIELLQKMEYIQLNDHNQLVAVEGKDISSYREAHKIHFESMVQLAAQSLYTQSESHNEFDSATVNLSQAQVEELKIRMKNLVYEMTKNQKKTENCQVYQFNFQLFALTKEEEVTSVQETTP